MLAGEFVYLRAIEPDDLETLLSWRNEESYRRYFREYRELNSVNQKEWYDKYVIKDPSTIMFSIVKKQTNTLVGACGLCYINWVNRSADFSIYIGHDKLYLDGKMAPDAGQIMMKYAFGELGLHRLWAEVYETDEVKIAFFERLRFKKDGYLRDSYWHEGTYVGSYIFSFLFDEYEWNRPEPAHN